MKRNDIDQIINKLNIELDKDVADSLKDELLTAFHTELTAEKAQTAAEQQKAKEAKQALEDLQKSYDSTVKDSESLEALKEQIKTLKADHEKKLAEIEGNYQAKLLNSAIENALSQAGAKNIKAVIPFIDSNNLKLNEDGSVAGLSEMIETVKKDESTSFLFNIQEKAEKNQPEIPKGGLNPQSGITGGKDSALSKEVEQVPINTRGIWD